MAMSKIARKKLFVNKSRIWNIEEATAGAPSNINFINKIYTNGVYVV